MVMSTKSSPGANVTLGVYVPVVAVEPVTGTSPAGLKEYCVASPIVVVAGFGIVTVKGLLLQISVGGGVVGTVAVMFSLIVRAIGIF
jgi:hypothetical protein